MAVAAPPRRLAISGRYEVELADLGDLP